MSAHIRITPILAAALFASACNDVNSPLEPKVRADIVVVVQAFQNVQLAQPADHVLGDADFVVKAVTDAPFVIDFFADGDCTLVGDATNSINPSEIPTAIKPDTGTVTIHLTDAGSCTVYASANSGLVAVSDFLYYAFDSAVDVKTFNITSGNAAPVLGGVTGPTNPQPSGSTVNVTASFTDANATDTHTAIVDWDDGNPSAAAISESSGAGALTASHTYNTPGVYVVRATVSDNQAAIGTATFSYVVVYDASGGFVTGGGWIASPAGACRLTTSCSTASGSASFGFVAKYLPGANAPSGNSEFLFQSGGLNFASTSYEWLVVSGPKAQFKGAGKVNGTGSYQFLLTANDGAVNGGGGVDRFRIKIWQRDTGFVIYDNQAGDADTSPATTALAGGSIVIRR